MANNTAAILLNQLTPLPFLNFLQRQRANLFSSAEDNASILFADKNQTTNCDQTKMKVFPIPFFLQFVIDNN